MVPKPNKIKQESTDNNLQKSLSNKVEFESDDDEGYQPQLSRSANVHDSDDGIYDKNLLKMGDTPFEALCAADILYDNILFLEERFNDVRKNKLKKVLSKFKKPARRTKLTKPEVGSTKFEKFFFQNMMVNSLEGQLNKLIVKLQDDENLKIDYTRPDKLNYPVPKESNIQEKSMDMFNIPKLKKTNGKSNIIHRKITRLR